MRSEAPAAWAGRRSSSRGKPALSEVEWVGFKDGLQQQDRRGLHYSIFDRRDAQRSLLSMSGL